MSHSARVIWHLAVAKRLREGAVLKVGEPRSEVWASIEELAAPDVEERGITKEKAIARVLKRYPDLYTLYECAERDAPEPSAFEKVERPDLPDFISERVHQLRKREPALTPELAVVKVLRSEPELYRRWLEHDNAS